MAGSPRGSTPELRAELLRLKELRRLLDILPAIYHDRLSRRSDFSARAMADDLLKCAVVLDGLRRLDVYVPQDFHAHIQTVRLSGDLVQPLAVAALLESIAAGLLARASRFAVPGTEIDWAVVRRAMRRAAVAVLDESIAADAMWLMRENAEFGLMGVGRAAGLVVGGSDAILAREADRIDAADPAAALASALEAAKEVRARIRRARRRISEAKRAPRVRRTRPGRARQPR